MLSKKKMKQQKLADVDICKHPETEKWKDIVKRINSWQNNESRQNNIIIIIVHRDM